MKCSLEYTHTHTHTLPFCRLALIPWDISTWISHTNLYGMLSASQKSCHASRLSNWCSLGLILPWAQNSPHAVMNIHTANVSPVSLCYWCFFSCANQMLRSLFLTGGAAVITNSVLNMGLVLEKKTVMHCFLWKWFRKNSGWRLIFGGFV